jgi:beta-galactosidase
MRTRQLLLAACALAGLSAASAGSAHAQTTLLSVDASTPPSPPRTGLMKFGTSTTPGGRSIGVNSRYLTRDGKPWLPVMGEFHYSRVPEQQWDDELAKMKSAGIDIVSTYIIWSHHEAQAGQFDWSGRRDLRRFVDTCARHGLLVFARVGPWVHAEIRYGGMPEWIVDQMPSRSNDPVYLAYVRRFYQQIGEQLHGRLWKDGGPVIGVQLENEYNLNGPQQGAAHIVELKRLALAAGLDTPLYTVTGWDNAVFPHREVTPVFGGYPDVPWGTAATKSPPSEVYAFRFTSRVGGDLGAQTSSDASGDADAVADETPFLGAEYGGGVPTMYRRRPVLDPDDVAAMLPVQLGSGVNLYGYYMFHGGRNPPGNRHGQESTATGGWNDLPVIDYDFQAPFGSNGEAHPVLGKLRPNHAFLHEWGSELASYAVHHPEIESRAADDLTTPRFSVRSDGERGFLFFNNHVRQHQMPAQTGVRFSVKLANRTIRMPGHPVDIPPDAYFIWPIAMRLGNADLRYSTAQPITRLATSCGDTYVFQAIDGIPAEFAFELKSVRAITAIDGTPLADLHMVDGALVVPLRAGRSALVTDAEGRKSNLVVLSARDAQRVAVLPFGGMRRLVFSDADMFEMNGQLVLRSIGEPALKLGFYPPLHQMPSSTSLLQRAPDSGVFQMFTTSVTPRAAEVRTSLVRDAREVPAIAQGGPAKASIEPTAETFGNSAAWRIDMPENALNGIGNAYLSIRYKGDVGRLFSGTELIDDNFYNGLEWRISLKNVVIDSKLPLTLTVLPLRTDAPVYIDERYDPRIEAKAQHKGQVASLESVSIVPEYEVRIGKQEVK